jgi:hypothetical protein
MDRTESRFAPSTEPASDDAASPFNFRTGDAADRLAFEPVPLRYRTGGLTPEKQREYVEALADTGLAREAAARVGISEQAINRVRRRSDAHDFDRACEAAHRFGARRLRSVAFERAIEGTLKGHYYHGELVSQERVYDNRLLIYLLGKTEHLLDPPEETAAICDNWEPCMEALEQGVPAPDLGLSAPDDDEEDDFYEPGSDPRAYCDEDGIWWTCFPPPTGFEGGEAGALGDPDYKRTLTAEEEAAMVAREAADDETEIARCCAIRDRFFGLPPRGAAGFSIPGEAETNETNEPYKEDDWGEGPIENESPTLRRPGESRDLGETRGGLPAPGPGFRRDDEHSDPTSKPPLPGILADEPPGEPK